MNTFSHQSDGIANDQYQRIRSIFSRDVLDKLQQRILLESPQKIGPTKLKDYLPRSTNPCSPSNNYEYNSVREEQIPSEELRVGGGKPFTE